MPRTLIHIQVTGNDERDNVINRYLDTLPKRKKSQVIKDILYRYIMGLLAPTAPLYIYVVNVTTFNGAKMGWKVQALDETNAIEQARTQIDLNVPGQHIWTITNVTQL